MSAERVVVIGAGMGGLAAAIDLAVAGLEVVVCEAQAYPGGKMRSVEVMGRPVDAGPTVFTLRAVFDSLFDHAGASFDEHVPTEAIGVLARHAWDAETRFDLLAAPDAARDAVAEFAGAAEARGFDRFRERAQTMFDTLDATFLQAQRPSMVDFVRRIGLSRPGALFGLDPLSTLWTALRRDLKDPRLVQLFGRYATYCGSSPFAAPATLMLIAHVEQVGVWSVKAGMQALPRAMADLAQARGAQIRYGAPVRRIRVEDGRAAGVELADGEPITAGAVVSNADAGAYAQGLLGESVRQAAGPVRPKDRSLSALVWTANTPTSGFPLPRHTVFFSRDYRDEFVRLFDQDRLPQEPTVYVCAQDRDDDARSPDGPERLLILTNAPAVGDRDGLSQEEIAQCEAATFDQLARCGLRVERSPERVRLTDPAQFHRLFPGTGGALYGRATHGPWATFQRPGARSRLPGLYLAGGSIHPSAGAPMATLSGRLAAKQLLQDRSSIKR
ncbi:MAG: 1-hydroxycarotenoid 3,4-desaturase CrtD [Maricaulaceae bacterium]